MRIQITIPPFLKIQYGTPLTIFTTNRKKISRSRHTIGGTKTCLVLTARTGLIKRRLLRKLETTEHDKFVEFILPRKTSELSFGESVKLLTGLFSPKTSLFHKRWKCLNLTKNDEDDFATYAAVVNKH